MMLETELFTAIPISSLEDIFDLKIVNRFKYNSDN
jgi:hypothetical protein